ncbi:hypothetical protein DFH27DRAFT_540424 [Peziza echinospora]|nr:hypothetical protein DFH27DRAFT_540424 [Peziza echinospora]
MEFFYFLFFSFLFFRGTFVFVLMTMAISTGRYRAQQHAQFRVALGTYCSRAQTRVDCSSPGPLQRPPSPLAISSAYIPTLHIPFPTDTIDAYIWGGFERATHGLDRYHITS